MQWTPPLWSIRSHRLKIAFCLMFAFFVNISMRSSLSMSIVCMVNSTAYAKEEFADLPPPEEVEADIAHGVVDGCPARVDEQTTAAVGYNGKLMWEPGLQSLLFSSNYYGSTVTVLISGFLADKFGPKKLLLSAVSILMFITFLGPTLANFSYWAFYASRVIMGMCEGFIVPCANSLGGRWFPATEKSAMAALYTSGNQLAAGSSALIGSNLCKVHFMDGWPLIFYLFGGVAFIWLIFFFLVASDYPAENRWIRSEEKEYLEGRVHERSKDGVVIPWKQLITYPPLYACLLCNFTFAFCVCVTQNYLPTYFKEELFLPLSSNGLYTVVPFFTQLVVKNIFASLADHLKKTGKLSATATVKIFQSIGSFGTAVALMCLATLPSCHRPWLAVASLIFYGIVFACGICGFFTSLLSIAPAYTGTLSSISMGSGQLAALIATNTVSFITYQGWPHKWFIVFSIAAAVQLVSGTVFLLWGSGEPASWATSNLTRPSELNMIGEPLKEADLTDDDEIIEDITPSVARARRKGASIERMRKLSREAALVRWTLNSGNGTPIIEEEDENEVIYLNNIRVQ